MGDVVSKRKKEHFQLKHYEINKKAILQSKISKITASFHYFNLYVNEIKRNSNNWNNISTKFNQAHSNISIHQMEDMDISKFRINSGSHEDVLQYNQFPLGMQIVDNYFLYIFWVPECKQSRTDFIEVNHIPVYDFKTIKEFEDYFIKEGWHNGVQDIVLIREAAKDTNRFRKIIKLQCKFDIKISISDWFWSPSGIKSRAYILKGSTWSSVFSAFCFFKASIGKNDEFLSTDLSVELFIENTMANDQYYGLNYKNLITENYELDNVSIKTGVSKER